MSFTEREREHIKLGKTNGEIGKVGRGEMGRWGGKGGNGSEFDRNMI